MKVRNYFLPMRDNVGRSTYEEREAFRVQALAIAGGWTGLGLTTGAWKGASGEVYLDECEVIAVAGEPHIQEELERSFWAHFRDQEALYVSEGEAHILNRPKRR